MHRQDGHSSGVVRVPVEDAFQLALLDFIDQLCGICASSENLELHKQPRVESLFSAVSINASLMKIDLYFRALIHSVPDQCSSAKCIILAKFLSYCNL